MAQKTIKDYFPSRKKQDRSKNASNKRSLESFTVPRSKRRRVTKVFTTPQDDELSRGDKRGGNNPLRNIRTRSISNLSTTPEASATTKSSEILAMTREATPAGASPLRRGAECVRLALEKKTASPVRLEGKDGKGKTETRRKLFSSEEDSAATVEGNTDGKISTDDVMLPPSVKPSIAALKKTTSDVKRTTSDVTRNDKQAPNLKPFTSLEYDSPTKSKSSTTPEKNKPLQPTVTDLPLPKHYELLAQKFHCTDTITNMFQRRGEICTFTKLKLAVQEMNGRLFYTSDLAKMKTVYPTALLLAQQTHIPGGYGREIFNSYQLTIECNLTELADDGQPASSSSTHLASSILLRRRQKFKRNLLNMVKKHHGEFLASLNMSITDNEIVRWHPAFVLDTVPEVEEAPLPQPPNSLTCCSTAKDLLDKVQSSAIPARMQQALEDVAACSSVGKPPEATPSNPAIDKALKGVSQSLVDKIKMKEANRAKAAMIRNHETEKKLTMLSALPDMCRIIKNLFLADKKAAMPAENVTNKLMDSNGISLDVTEAHLKLILEVLPQWIKTVTVRKTTYIKIDRNTSIKSILEEIKRYRELL